MKHSTRIAALVVAGVASLSFAALPATFAAPGDLSDVQAADLAFNRDEERLARDLYQAFADKYDGARPFSQITISEQRHFDAVGRLLTTYGVDDPSAGAAVGSFTDPALQALYDDWYARGMTSVEEAYQVGVELEKRDIADLEDSIAASTAADITRTLENLKDGSENHLAAFERAASGQAGQGNGQAGQGNGQAGQQGQAGQPRQGNAQGRGK